MPRSSFFQWLIRKLKPKTQPAEQGLRGPVVGKPMSDARLLHIKRRQQEMMVRKDLRESQAALAQAHQAISSKYGLNDEEMRELEANASLGLRYNKKLKLWTGGHAKARSDETKSILRQFTPENRQGILNLLSDKKLLQERVEENIVDLEQARTARIIAFNRLQAERNKRRYLGE